MSSPIPCSRLHSNHLFCDCHLAWLSQWLRQRPTIGLFTQCSGPAGLRGLNVAEVQKSEFSCSGGCRPCWGSQISIACLLPASCSRPGPPVITHSHRGHPRPPVLIRGRFLDHTPSTTLTHSLLSRLTASCPQSPPSPASATTSCSQALPLSTHRLLPPLHFPSGPHHQSFPVACPLSLCPHPFYSMPRFCFYPVLPALSSLPSPPARQLPPLTSSIPCPFLCPPLPSLIVLL